MPRIIIQAFKGRSLEQKRELVRRITEVTVEVFKVTPDTVTIRIEEGDKENFAKAGVLASDRDGPEALNRPRRRSAEAWSVAASGSVAWPHSMH